jgi:hypothetical protein
MVKAENYAWQFPSTAALKPLDFAFRKLIKKGKLRCC